MRLSVIMERIDSVAPFADAEAWDNSGLLVGDPRDEVHRAAVCLDATSSSVGEAAVRGCDLLVTHHPLIFSPIRRIGRGSVAEDAIRAALVSGVSVLCVHTNWDLSCEGVNAVLSGLLGLAGCSPLRKTESKFGRVGDLPPLRFDDFLPMLKERWGLSWLSGYGSREKTIRSVAVCGGSGREFLRDAVEAGADVFCTADLTYHDLMEANHAGLCIALADHGEMERLSMKRLSEIIAGDDLSVDVLPSEGPGKRFHV